ncbi:MAG: hypothetical protein ACYTGV_08595, partial [Planctomycetota bacterium]
RRLRMDRRDYVIAGLAAALLFCVGVLVGQSVAVLPSAHAQDSGDTIPKNPVPGSAEAGSGVTINRGPDLPRIEQRTYSPTASDSDSNNRFVAITCPVGSGESVLFVLDSKTEHLAVYRFLRKKGLEFVAGRKIDYDLKISEWKDISEFSRNEMRRLYDRQVAREKAEEVKGKKSG